MNILDQLKYPFEASKIHWRVGATSGDKSKGIALAYLDARDVMERLDMVCGADWQCRYSHNGPQGTICEIGILLDGEWRWRANGAGETDYEAQKGAMSDAFKRAAVLWGVGQYLYHLGAEWVPITSQGRSYVIKEADQPKMPKQFLPDPPLWRLHELWRVAAECSEYVDQIREGIDTGDLKHAARSWHALSDESKIALWVAPTKGGILTTEERKIIKSDAFAAAAQEEAA